MHDNRFCLVGNSITIPSCKHDIRQNWNALHAHIPPPHIFYRYYQQMAYRNRHIAGQYRQCDNLLNRSNSHNIHDVLTQHIQIPVKPTVKHPTKAQQIQNLKHHFFKLLLYMVLYKCQFCLLTTSCINTANQVNLINKLL